MTDRYVIHRDRRRGVWVVQRHGDYQRHVADFPTLVEAEQWVIEQGEPT
jgi:hypothetical protein